jgi:hypothetical protein
VGTPVKLSVSSALERRELSVSAHIVNEYDDDDDDNVIQYHEIWKKIILLFIDNNAI